MTKSIYEWIQRRREFADMELASWKKLTDKGLRDGEFMQSNGTKTTVKVRRYYDPQEKDNQVSALEQEPFLIDAALEIVNCQTDLVD